MSFYKVFVRFTVILLRNVDVIIVLSEENLLPSF